MTILTINIIITLLIIINLIALAAIMVNFEPLLRTQVSHQGTPGEGAR